MKKLLTVFGSILLLASIAFGLYAKAPSLFHSKRTNSSTSRSNSNASPTGLQAYSSTAQQAKTPSVGIAANPDLLIVNTPGIVTITSVITDPSLIPQSVSILRLDDSGKVIANIGHLHDDGINGDVVAGDQTFTIQVPFNEGSAGQIHLQVSAAFRGMLRRVLSKTLTVNVGNGFTLQGTFSQVNQVQLFDVTVTTDSAVDLRSFGYAGGITPTGVIVPRGGFDSILTLFNSEGGAFRTENNDGAGVGTDLLTGRARDARITHTLVAGSYILALTQYDNFSSGALGSGFDQDGVGNFTAEFDARCNQGQFVNGSLAFPNNCRNGNWTIYFANVASVTLRRGGIVP